MENFLYLNTGSLEVHNFKMPYGHEYTELHHMEWKVEGMRYQDMCSFFYIAEYCLHKMPLLWSICTHYTQYRIVVFWNMVPCRCETEILMSTAVKMCVNLYESYFRHRNFQASSLFISTILVLICYFLLYVYRQFFSFRLMCALLLCEKQLIFYFTCFIVENYWK
jgi:hypothetical protein